MNCCILIVVTAPVTPQAENKYQQLMTCMHPASTLVVIFL